MDPRPTIGGAAGAAQAGCQDIKQVLYESKKSEISEQKLQEISAKLNMGADPNKKLSEEDARALRNIIDGGKLEERCLNCLPRNPKRRCLKRNLKRNARNLWKLRQPNCKL